MDGAFGNQDYGMDGGRGGRGGGRSGFRGNADNAKTKLCNRWMQGECRFGDRCNFAHGETELRAGHDQDGGGRGYGRGRGYDAYGGRGPAPGRGYGQPGGGYGGGYPVMGGFQAGYGMDQARGGYEAMGGMPEEQWAAQQGSPLAGPNGWCRYRAKDTGEFYYHNHRTGVTQWDKPADWI